MVAKKPYCPAERRAKLCVPNVMNPCAQSLFMHLIIIHKVSVFVSLGISSGPVGSNSGGNLYLINHLW